MWIRLKDNADVREVQGLLQGMGLWTTPVQSVHGQSWSLSVAPHSAFLPPEMVADVPGVDDVLASPSPHPKVNHQAGRSVSIGHTRLGVGEPPVLMAGPCSVESEAQIHAAAQMVAKAGAAFLRGGAFKPRTSPYSFGGHGVEALKWMREAANAHGLDVVTEVLSEADAPRVAEAADVLQVGSRNMQNFALLRAVGAVGRPVLLKRGMAATVEEWLLAGEHLLAAGAPTVVFCERGIQSFDPATRNLLDLGAVALLKHVHGQAVAVDPSHAVGRRDLIPAMARAARAAGADALLIEAHPNPAEALSDGPQALDGEALAEVAQDLF
ncbi:MAG TPA: 3-deoxy-7-phosphoheptulonate synthase [Myxococcota bacterium]|nr:3-deoxy-7-phosphoheptulonate synthase [Myxococcota bacterium]